MTTSNAPTSETSSSFQAETERHLVAFWHDLTETAFRPMPSVVVMAADLLAREHGPSASWERFEMSAFFDRVVEAAHGFCSVSQSERYRATLVAFLSFLADDGVIAAEVVERAAQAPLPPEYTDSTETENADPAEVEAAA